MENRDQEGSPLSEMHTLAQHPYLQKIEAARRQVGLHQFPDMWDVSGRHWPGSIWHVMYTSRFIGYFLYRITGLRGDIEPYSTTTWWGLELDIPPGEVHGDYYEQPLSSIEVKAWLALNYSHLEADDYEYLIDILWLEQTPDDYTVYHLRNYYNWKRALEWLTEQHARAKASGPVVAVSATTQSIPTGINPWAPLLVGSLKLDEFYEYLKDYGLLTSDGNLTLLGQGDGLGKARKAPWVGALLALKKEKLLDNNMAAISRALAAPLGKIQVKLSENSLLNPTNKSDTYQQMAEAILTKSGYLRN